MITSRTFRLILLHLIAGALFASLFLPTPLKTFWAFLDHSFFYFANGSVGEHPIQGLFWSLANIKITDLYGASFFLLSFLLYVYEGKSPEARRVRFGHLIYTLFWFEVSILFTKQVLTPICEYFKLSRHSPTVVLPEVIRLSSFCPWAKIKDHSHFCFPSDHAVIVFQWSLFFTFFSGIKRGGFVSLFSLIFLLPRLISGAHWISDILAGSLPIVLVAFAWGTQSPIYDRAMNWLQTRIIRIPDWKSY
ncbi:MAG: phosphatase PAP2 family protein [Chlamydia sp.]